MHVLTLVVWCGDPKPLTVDPATISLLERSRAFDCDALLLPAALTKTLVALLTMHGNKQPTEIESHGQAAEGGSQVQQQ